MADAVYCTTRVKLVAWVVDDDPEVNVPVTVTEYVRDCVPGLVGFVPELPPPHEERAVTRKTDNAMVATVPHERRFF